MAYLNKSFLMGNLTRDPELRHTSGGSPVCEMTIAVNRRVNGKEDVSYIDVVVWGKSAENCSRYLTKGSSAMVEGYLKQESWEDRQSGQRRSKLKLVAENVQFMSSPRSGSESSGNRQAYSGGYTRDDDPQPPYTPEPDEPRQNNASMSQPSSIQEPPPSGPGCEQPDLTDDIPF